MNIAVLSKITCHVIVSTVLRCGKVGSALSSRSHVPSLERLFYIGFIVPCVIIIVNIRAVLMLVKRAMFRISSHDIGTVFSLRVLCMCLIDDHTDTMNASRHQGKVRKVGNAFDTE